MKKIIFIISKRRNEKISQIINYFENLSYKFLDENVKFEIFSEKLDQDILLLKKLCINVKYTLEKVSVKNWIKEVKKKRYK